MKHYFYNLFLILTVSMIPIGVIAQKKLTNPSTEAQGQTMVLCIGTIHDQHKSNPNYSYKDLYNIIKTFHPDAICVEIRLSDFRKKPYLKEMTLGAIYGIKNGANVYPIDWWPQNNPRAERREYIKSDDYKIKQQRLDSLYRTDSLICAFEKRYGTLDNLFKDNDKSYLFINGKDYNTYVSRIYAGLITVFGDGCLNLYSEQRNAKMMNLIEDAVRANLGRRVIILTGAEHKYYFDKALSNRKEIHLVQLENLLPLENSPIDADINEYLVSGISDLYYTNKEIMYWTALTPILHGPNMDTDPSIIKEESLRKAEKILKQWEENTNKSILLSFNLAWYYFLSKQYNEGIAVSRKVKKHLSEVPDELRKFIIPTFWRNLGFCYDAKGQRKKAVQSYRTGIQYCKDNGINKETIEYIFKNYEQVPFRL
ncbi:UNVERIFIED_CONTAM: DUF5694 domain-containing protein [Prevotella sp. 15_C9]